MKEMIVGADEKYFEEKFNNMNGKLDAIVTAISKHDDKIDTIEKDVIKLAEKQDSHLDWHGKKDSNAKFNIQSFLSVLALIITLAIMLK